MDGVRGAAVLAAVAAFGGGAIFSVVEKGYGVWDGMWLAITTMSTVGYGDISPHTKAGRLVAVTLMLVGVGFVALLTGAVAERFLSPEIKEIEVAEAEVAIDVGDFRAELVRELRGISARSWNAWWNDQARSRQASSLRADDRAHKPFRT